MNSKRLKWAALFLAIVTLFGAGIYDTGSYVVSKLTLSVVYVHPDSPPFGKDAIIYRVKDANCWIDGVKAFPKMDLSLETKVWALQDNENLTVYAKMQVDDAVSAERSKCFADGKVRLNFYSLDIKIKTVDDVLTVSSIYPGMVLISSDSNSDLSSLVKYETSEDGQAVLFRVTIPIKVIGDRDAVPLQIVRRYGDQKAQQFSDVVNVPVVELK